MPVSIYLGDAIRSPVLGESVVDLVGAQEAEAVLASGLALEEADLHRAVADLLAEECAEIGGVLPFFVLIQVTGRLEPGAPRLRSEPERLRKTSHHVESAVQ